MTQYTDKITSEHAKAAKFVAKVGISTNPFIAVQSALAAMPAGFDLDQAIGAQLDAVGLWIGSAIFLAILADASEYTAVGRDSTGEMVLVEFDEADRHGNLSGVMWRRLEVIEVDGKWCGKGLARFEGVKVEVVK